MEMSDCFFFHNNSTVGWGLSPQIKGQTLALLSLLFVSLKNEIAQLS